MLFSDWTSIFRVVIVGVLAYTALIVVLRISGKRTLSKMNAFDLIVTVALGSTLATVLLSKDVALAEGITAFLTLILLQFVITWLSVRSTRLSALVKSEPRLLFFRGQFIQRALLAERVTAEEVIAALRAAGIAQLEAVEAVVLETDGSFSALPRPDSGAATALRNVSGVDEAS